MRLRKCNAKCVARRHYTLVELTCVKCPKCGEDPRVCPADRGMQTGCGRTPCENTPRADAVMVAWEAVWDVPPGAVRDAAMQKYADLHARYP